MELDEYGRFKQEAVKNRMAILGITLDNSKEDRIRFEALQDLLAWAIFDWADCKDDVRDVLEENPGWNHDQALYRVVDGLSEWAQEWLVG